MIQKPESLEKFHEFGRKWVARIEESRSTIRPGIDDGRSSLMKAWKMDIFEPLILDFVSARSSDEPMRVVERWTIHYFPEEPQNYITKYNILEKRLSVLTRTIYSVCRLLPAFTYFREMPDVFSSIVYTSSNPPHSMARIVHIQPEFRKFYSFPRIPLRWGSISVTVEYLASKSLQV